MPQRFEQLGERLLRAGIAPRHVRRYTMELRDHFDDLLREEIAAGSDSNAAKERARARIGSDEALAAVMLARPGLRSIASRYPWAVFGFAPVLMLIATMVGAIVIEAGLLRLHIALTGGPGLHLPPPMWLKLFVSAWNAWLVYAAPLMIAAILFLVGGKQRTPAGWIVVALGVTCIVGGFHNVGVIWPDGLHPGRLSASFLGPQYSRAMVIGCILRAAANLALVGSAYFLWLRRDSSRFAQ